MAIDSLASVNMHAIFHTSANNSHMMSARGQQSVPWKDMVAVFRLFYADPAERVETFGILVGKSLRHMLHDHDARKISRQLRQ